MNTVPSMAENPFNPWQLRLIQSTTKLAVTGSLKVPIRQTAGKGDCEGHYLPRFVESRLICCRILKRGSED
jgi:hypothetical protein